MEKLSYIAYCRRSSEDSRERQALSIPAQVDEIKKRFKELKIVGWFEESHSAFDIGRPKFNEMVKLIRSKKADGIICWHPDRIARNAVDGGTIIDLLDKGFLKDLKFCSYTYNNDAEGKMMLGIMFSQSKYFSDKLSKDVIRGRDKKIRNGQWPGMAPVGYLNTYTKARGENEIIPDPERFHLVRKMWDLLLTGNYAVPRILKIANGEWGFRTMKRKMVGGNPMCMSNGYNLFSNPFYCGIIRHKGQYYPATHQPVVTQDEFDKAQIILGKKGRPRPQTHHFDFTGLIVCGECGCSITAEEKTKILMGGTPKNYIYYRCTKKKFEKKCSQKPVVGSYVENFILEKLSELQIDIDFVNFAKKYLNELNDKEINNRSSIYVNIENAYSTTQKYLDRLTKAYYREIISEEEFVKQRDELLVEKSRLKKQLDQVENRANNWLELATEAFEFAHYARYWFEEGGIDRRKNITSKLGSNFILKDKKLTFQMNILLEIIMKGKNKIKIEAARLELENNGFYSYKTPNLSTVSCFWQGIINRYLFNKFYDRKDEVLKNLLSACNIKMDKDLEVTIWKINENFLCRNLVVHNKNKVNEEYLTKAGEYAKFKIGEIIKVSEEYLFEQGDNLLFFMQNVRKKIE